MYNGGQWTDARFNSFIKSALRVASNKWPPKHRVKKRARIERGIYKCAGYKREAHEATASILIENKRVNNIHVDHIKPVIGSEGFVSWDEVIERMFVEDKFLQILCKKCHDEKTRDERALRKKNKNV